MTEQFALAAIRAAAYRSIEIAAALRLDESGTDVAEYALLLAMLGLSMVASFGPFSALVANLFSHVGTSFSNAA
jgi:Flp pilus assembly pilin Flp